MRTFPLLLSLIIVVMLAAPAAAQDGVIKVYFDAALSQRTMDCPGPGLDTLYVVAEGFDCFVIGCEYKIEYPPSMIWLGDLDVPPVTIGTTPTGISMGFALPLNGYFPALLHRVLILWNCTDCSATNQAVRVVDHPLFDHIAITDFPSFNLIEGGGQGSLVCPDFDLDIKPGSCPNPFNEKLFDWADGSNPRKGGVLPVAILGSAEFDVSQIDVTTLALEGVAPVAAGKSPLAKINDVAGPAPDGYCVCSEDGPDGFDDLTMRFNSQQIADAIGGSPGPGTKIPLTLTGMLFDGTPFEATDCVRIVGNEVKEQPLPALVTELGFAQPNPFNPSTRIQYAIPDAAHVTIAVYDVAGRRVAMLVDETKSPGQHVVEWNAANLPSGVYFYRMTVGNETFVRRAILVK